MAEVLGTASRSDCVCLADWRVRDRDVLLGIGAPDRSDFDDLSLEASGEDFPSGEGSVEDAAANRVVGAKRGSACALSGGNVPGGF